MRGSRATDASAVVLEAEALPWKEDATDDVVDQADDEERARARMQQAKIVNYFAVDEQDVVSPEEIVRMDSRSLRQLKRERQDALRRAALEEKTPESDLEKRKSFLQRVAKGEITTQDETNFLLLIRDPINLRDVGPTKMFARIAADPRQTQILAVAAGYNLKNWQKVDKEALDRILGAVQTNGDDYRTPVGFASLREYFLKGIRPKAKEQVYRCYEQSMDELEKTLYGKRLEYYQQFEALKKEAEKQPEAEAKPVTVLRTGEAYQVVTPERSGEMLGRAAIDGDAWHGNGIDSYLNTHEIAQANLGPAYEVQVGETKVCLSQLFVLGDGQVVALGFVPEGSSYKVRAFYRNNALGLWCYLPDYTRRTDGGLDGFGVGYGISSVILPSEMQVALAQLERKGKPKVLARPGEAEAIFAGSAHAYDSSQEYQTLWTYGRLRGDYYREVSTESINHDFGLNGTMQKKAPYTLAIDFDRAPDFKKLALEFETAMTDAGMVQIQGFKSHDEQYLWWFCRDAKGRAWVCQVEAISPLTTVGLRRDWTVMGDFTTPLYEYTTQAGIYGDRSDTKGPKQCMWNNYLSNVPLIQEYLKVLQG